jgi:hypothetical protein
MTSKKQLNAKYSGYCAYYVEIIPKGVKKYNRPFCPPDNRTKTRRQKNELVRVIDGYSFYGIVTGVPNALELLYRTLPQVIGEVLGRNLVDLVKGDTVFIELFKKAY